MKPFGQPVTEIFDFEEGSRFAALTVLIPQLQFLLSIAVFVCKHNSVPTIKSTRVIHRLGLT